MRPTLHGTAAGPAVAVVGVWDPLRRSHVDLFTELSETCRISGRSSLVVLIDPAPGSISTVVDDYGTNGWPVYDSVPVRIRLIRALGVDAVMVVRFQREDFAATAAQFLGVVRSEVELAGLWLGEAQFLGAGAPGSPAAVSDYARRHDVAVRRLPRAPLVVYDERLLLAAGRLALAIDQVGRPPMRIRPRSSTIRLAWRAGRYLARPLDRPGSPAGGADLQVEVVPQTTSPAILTWPDRNIRFLAFVSGPADLDAG